MQAAEDFFAGMRATRRRPVDWLARAVPLWPKHSRVQVVGVAWDADEALRRYWLQLGRAAAAGTSETESP
jgi:hypothetical protein